MSHTSSINNNNSQEILLGPGCQLLCIAKISFYEITSDAEWKLKYDETDLCLIKDHKNRAYFYKLILADKFVWDFEIFTTLAIQIENDEFMYIKDEAQMFGFYFESSDELSTFSDQTDNIIKRMNRRPKRINPLFGMKSNKKRNATSTRSPKNRDNINANTNSNIQSRPLPSIPNENENDKQHSPSSSDNSNEYLPMQPSTKLNSKTKLLFTPKQPFGSKNCSIVGEYIHQYPSRASSDAFAINRGSNSYDQSNFDSNFSSIKNTYSNEYLPMDTINTLSNDWDNTYLPSNVKDMSSSSPFEHNLKKHVDEKNRNKTTKPLPKLPIEKGIGTSSLNTKPCKKSLPPIPCTTVQGPDLSPSAGRPSLKIRENNIGNRYIPDISSQMKSVHLKSVDKHISNQSSLKPELTKKPQLRTRPIMNKAADGPDLPQFPIPKKPILPSTNNFGPSINENRNTIPAPLDMLSEIRKGIPLRPVKKTAPKSIESSKTSDSLGQILRQTLNNRFVSINGCNNKNEDNSESDDESNNDWD